MKKHIDFIAEPMSLYTDCQDLPPFVHVKITKDIIKQVTGIQNTLKGLTQYKYKPISISANVPQGTAQFIEPAGHRAIKGMDEVVFSTVNLEQTFRGLLRGKPEMGVSSFKDLKESCSFEISNIHIKVFKSGVVFCFEADDTYYCETDEIPNGRLKLFLKHLEG